MNYALLEKFITFSIIYVNYLKIKYRILDLFFFCPPHVLIDEMFPKKIF